MEPCQGPDLDTVAQEYLSPKKVSLPSWECQDALRRHWLGRAEWVMGGLRPMGGGGGGGSAHVPQQPVLAGPPMQVSQGAGTGSRFFLQHIREEDIVPKASRTRLAWEEGMCALLLGVPPSPSPAPGIDQFDLYFRLSCFYSHPHL